MAIYQSSINVGFRRKNALNVAFILFSLKSFRTTIKCHQLCEQIVLKFYANNGSFNAEIFQTFWVLSGLYTHKKAMLERKKKKLREVRND